MQPFLRKETSELNLKNGENLADSANETKIAESNLISQNLNLDGCFASLTNPMDCHDSALQNLAMTAKIAESNFNV
ncbi:hypothetical protein [Helicobacter sp. 23-1045]